MNVNQLLIKLSKIAADQRSKNLVLLVEGKELDLNIKQLTTRTDGSILLEVGTVTPEVKEVKKEVVKEEAPKVEDDSKVITANDIKEETPSTPKKRGRKKKVETKDEE